MQERFQPRTLAQFSVHQMEQVLKWVHSNGVNEAARARGMDFTGAFYGAVETASLDEKGK